MKNQELIQREDLPDALGRLETFLCDHCTTDGLWPLENLEEKDIENFINSLYLLSWECLAIHLRENMPSFPIYRAAVFYGGNFPDMIHITRKLVQCCNQLLMEEYRDITNAELETIILLNQLHHALIGHFYFQHPGLDTVSANEIRFYK